MRVPCVAPGSPSGRGRDLYLWVPLGQGWIQERGVALVAGYVAQEKGRRPAVDQRMGSLLGQVVWSAASPTRRALIRKRKVAAPR